MRVVLRTDVRQRRQAGRHRRGRRRLRPQLPAAQGPCHHRHPGVEAQADAMRRSRDLRDARDREAAETVARTLVPAVIRIPARAGAEGKLFGSVTAADVAEAVAAQTGVELDRRQLHLDEPIKSLGTHEVPVKLHADVEFRVTVEVAKPSRSRPGHARRPATAAPGSPGAPRHRVDTARLVRRAPQRPAARLRHRVLARCHTLAVHVERMFGGHQCSHPLSSTVNPPACPLATPQADRQW